MSDKTQAPERVNIEHKTLNTLASVDGCFPKSYTTEYVRADLYEGMKEAWQENEQHVRDLENKVAALQSERDTLQARVGELEAKIAEFIYYEENPKGRE